MINEEVCRLFKSVIDSNCCEQANGLAERIRATGHSAKVRRVFHGLNVFGDNPLLNCEHVCGENYSQHFVVECEENILDPKLNFHVSLFEYLKKAYYNHRDLRIA